MNECMYVYMHPCCLNIVFLWIQNYSCITICLRFIILQVARMWN